MNYMPEVLKMLGVEVGEEFNVTNWCSNPYKFNKNYELRTKYDSAVDPSNLFNLLKGNYEIEKLPWKPKDGDDYYRVIIICRGADIIRTTWDNDSTDFYTYNAGNCFRTAEEITGGIKERILREMKEKYENG